jgi:hypothetical protein
VKFKDKTKKFIQKKTKSVYEDHEWIHDEYEERAVIRTKWKRRVRTVSAVISLSFLFCILVNRYADTFNIPGLKERSWHILFVFFILTFISSSMLAVYNFVEDTEAYHKAKELNNENIK